MCFLNISASLYQTEATVGHWDGQFLHDKPILGFEKSLGILCWNLRPIIWAHKTARLLNQHKIWLKNTVHQGHMPIRLHKPLSILMQWHGYNGRRG